MPERPNVTGTICQEPRADPLESASKSRRSPWQNQQGGGNLWEASGEQVITEDAAILASCSGRQTQQQRENKATCAGSARPRLSQYLIDGTYFQSHQITPAPKVLRVLQICMNTHTHPHSRFPSSSQLLFSPQTWKKKEKKTLSKQSCWQ